MTYLTVKGCCTNTSERGGGQDWRVAILSLLSRSNSHGLLRKFRHVYFYACMHVAHDAPDHDDSHLKIGLVCSDVYMYIHAHLYNDEQHLAALPQYRKCHGTLAHKNTSAALCIYPYRFLSFQPTCGLSSGPAGLCLASCLHGLTLDHS